MKTIGQKRIIQQCLKDIAQKHNLQIRVDCDGWMIQLQSGSRETMIWGYTFNINGAASHFVLKDKFALASLLQQKNIPTIPGVLVFADFKEEYANREQEGKDIQKMINTYGFPLIYKKNTGGGGKHVYFAESQEQLKTLQGQTKDSFDMVLQPYIQNAKEYRFVVYKNDILLSFQKNRSEESLQNKEGEDWFKHNFAHGAQLSTDISERVTNFAQEVIGKLSSFIQFYTLDIFEDENGVLMVLEINGGVALEKASAMLPNGYQRVKNVYEQVVTDLLLD